MPSSTVNVAEYLYRRLVQLGVKDLHGVPGDFNLLALDFVESSGLSWIGNCNELNAGYAADAYGRVVGMGALMTTFGVGELSCVNATAGSFAEFVPVVHIVGTPNKSAQQSGSLLHHTLADGDFKVFSRIAKEINAAQADLTDLATAPAEIDRVLRTCYVTSRPVYIALPTDMVTQKVDASLLDTPIDLEPPKSDSETETFVADRILSKLYAAKNPVLVIDAGANRHRIEDLAESFAKKTGLPTFITPMGKGAANESLPNFIGMYNGAQSPEDLRRIVDSSDLVITIGNVKSDLNSGGFTWGVSRLTAVDLHYDNVEMDCAMFKKIYMKWLLQILHDKFDSSKMQKSAGDIPKISPTAVKDEGSTEAITHAYLWPRISSWFKSDDVVVADTGTSYVGMWGTKLPSRMHVITQILWSSIGFGVGACQGAALAMKSEGKGRRTICFEGDGSFQLTAQEVSTIIHHNLDAIMFVIENDGYEIERWVHGPEASYNDIRKWKYSKLPDVFTPSEKESESNVKTYKIGTRSELEALLADPEFSEGKGLRFVELHMPRNDAPQALIDFAKGASKRSS